jgi:hypothetical protein
MPVINLGKNSEFEEAHMRQLILFNQLRRTLEAESDPDDFSWTVAPELVQQQTELDKVALQVYRSVMQSDRTQKALDWATSFSLMKSMNIAAQWAQLSNFSQLSERVLNLREGMFGEDGSAAQQQQRPAKRRRVVQSIPSSDVGDEYEDDDVVQVYHDDDAMDIDEQPSKAKGVKGSASKPTQATPASGKKANPFAKSSAPIGSPTKDSDIFSAISRIASQKPEAKGKPEKNAFVDSGKKKTAQRLFG